MSINGVRRWGVVTGLAGGAAAVIAMLGAGAAHADDTSTTVDLSGWTVQLGPEKPLFPAPPPGAPWEEVDFEKLSELLLFPHFSQASATLMDPTDALGLGKEVTGGSWNTFTPYFTPSGAFNQLFEEPPVTAGAPLSLSPFNAVENAWLLPWLELAVVDVDTSGPGDGNAAYFLAPALGGKEVVALFEAETGHTVYPVVNPDATGPVDVGGLPLASPPDGALFNDLFDAAFKGDAADWGKATTLFGDLLGLDHSSAAAGAVDSGGLLPDLGF